MTSLPHRPHPVVLTAPSGAGKTSIARGLVEGGGGFVFSVSATTRPRRPGERDGVDYHFVERERFEAMARGGELCEWAEVHGNLYGTPLANLEEAALRGEHPVMDIDVQGARQIRQRLDNALMIFVFPPSGEALRARLARRGTEAGAEMARRLRTARDEMAAAAEFDYVVVNERLEATVRQVREIVRAEAHRPGHALDLDGAIRRIREGIDAVVEAAASK